MTTTVADLRAKIGVDGVEKSKSDLKQLHEGISTLKNGFVAGLGAVTGFFTGFAGFNIATDALGFVKDQLLGVLQAGMDQQKVMAQTDAVLRSTHDAAGMTAAQIGDLADSYARLTGVSDDQIQSAENILLTFTNIKSNVFPQTTQAVLDMATAMHEDLQTAALQVGKAMQDPAQMSAALRREGVALTDSQIKLMTQFEKTGHMADAQKILLGELDKEFGKSAEASGKTLPGMLARLNVSWQQLEEKVGLAVIPALSTLISKYLMPAADWLGQQLPGAITTLTGFLDHELLPAIDNVMNSPVVTTLESWATAIAQKVSPAFNNKGLAGSADTASGALKRTDGNAKTLGDNLAGPFVAKVQKAIDKLDGATTSLGGDNPHGKGLNPAVLRVNDNLTKMDAALDRNAAAQQKNKQATQQSIPVISGIGDKFKEAGDAIAQFGTDISERLPGAMPQIKRFGTFLSDTFQGVLPGLQTEWEGFWAFLSMPVRVALQSIENIFNVGLDILQGDWKKAENDAQAGTDKIGQIILDGIKGLGKMLIGPWQAAVGGWIAAITHFPDLLAPEIKQAFQDTIPNLEATINNWAHQIQQYISDHTPHIPGISLPGMPGQQRASGGPTSGDFIGAEEAPELLVTPGVYHAPPGSYVYNAQQTAAIMNGQMSLNGAQTMHMSNSGQRLSGGTTYSIVVNGADHASAMRIAREVDQQLRRRELLTGMGVA